MLLRLFRNNEPALDMDVSVIYNMNEKELARLTDSVEAMKPLDHGFFKVVTWMEKYLVILSMFLISLYVAPVFSSQLFRIIVNIILFFLLFYVHEDIKKHQLSTKEILSTLVAAKPKRFYFNTFYFYFFSITVPLISIIFLRENDFLSKEQEVFLVFSVLWLWLYTTVYFSEDIFLLKILRKWKFHQNKRLSSYGTKMSKIKTLLFGFSLFIFFVMSNFFTWVTISNIINEDNNLKDIHSLNTLLVCIIFSILFTTEIITCHLALKRDLILGATKKYLQKIDNNSL